MHSWPAQTHLFLCQCWLCFSSFYYRARPNLFHQEQEEIFSCPHFCMGNLETEGGLCLTGSLPGASASSSSGISTFLHFPFLSSVLPPPSFPPSHISPPGLLFFFLWHLACAFPVASVPILLPFFSTITLMPRPPADRLHCPWRFGFPFPLRSGSLMSPPGTAPSRARHSFWWWLRTSSAGRSG